MFSQFFWFLRHVHKDWGWSLGFRLRSFCTSQIFLCCWCGILLSTSLLHFAHRTVSLFIALVCSSHLHMYNTFVKTYRSWIKTSARAGCGAYLAATNIHKFSTYAISELFAILHALCLIYSLKLAKAGIRTDSLNSLQSITNWNYNRSQITIDHKLLCSTLSVTGYEVKLVWIPTHLIIPGNEIADQAEPSPDPLQCLL